MLIFFLLGFKEHLGAVPIGFGLWYVLRNPQKKLGYFLIIMGILSIYLLMFELKPFFRESTIKYNDINMLDPFKDFGSKIIYFFGYLLLPVLFIPLLFPKNGILAGPAIGINLISGYSPMYSSHYHYDDVSSTLLLIATIVSLGSIKLHKFELWIKQKKTLQIFLVIWFMFFLVLLPYSSLRFIKDVIPKAIHQEIINEIRQFDEYASGRQIAVQDVLGPHFYRKEIQVFYPGTDCTEGNTFYQGLLPHGLPQYQFLVLAPDVSHWGIDDMEKCLKDLDQDPNYRMIDGYRKLIIFHRLSGQSS